MSHLRRATTADLDRLIALQRSAYARNRPLLGVEPLPLLADYVEIFGTMEIWLAEEGGQIVGALILEQHPDHLLIWSIATDPAMAGQGIGREMLARADARARELGLDTVRLYTASKLGHLVAWYGRNGYDIERVQELPDRSLTHMRKQLSASNLPPVST